MRISEILLEYDEKKIASLDRFLANRPDPSRPSAGSARDLADIIDKKYRPSGEVLFWMLHRYLRPLSPGKWGINRWEDIGSRLVPALEKYAKLKNKKLIPSEKRDLNRIGSLAELEDLLDKFPDEDLSSRKERATSEEQEFYNSGKATLLHNDAVVKVVVPHTKDASCYFGKATRWCTAAKANNMFDAYDRNGPLYIVLIKPLNQRYQFHWSRSRSANGDQFMDEQDREIDPKELADRYPVLWRIFTPIAEKNESLVLNADPSPELRMKALFRDGNAIRWLKDPTPRERMRAVSVDGDAIRWIKDPTPEEEMEAVSGNGESIRYIKDPSPKVQLAAVENLGKALRHIKDPAPEVQLAAIEGNWRSIKLIANPTQEAQIAAVTRGASAIQDIRDPGRDVQMAAVESHPGAIRFIRDPDPEIQLAAVRGNGIVIQDIRNPTPEVQLAAVKRNPNAIMHIKDPTPDAQLAAVGWDGNLVRFIGNPTPAAQLAAVESDPTAIQYIADPTPGAKALARSRGYADDPWDR